MVADRSSEAASMPAGVPDGVLPGDLAFVVNSFNRRVLLERALRSIYEQVLPWPAEVVVIDDGSTDGSAEFVEGWIASNQYPGLRLVRPERKVAFAGGVNLGVLVSRAPYVCLFETDNVALDAGMWRGVEYLKKNPRVAGVGFRVVTMAGATAGNSMAFPRPLAFVLGQQLTQRFGLEAPGLGPRRDVIFTSPLILSRAALAEVGLMNAVDFPFSDSDLDLCRRVYDAGYELHVLEDIAVVHDQGEHHSEFSRRRALDFHRARLEYFRRHAGAAAWPLIRGGVLLRHLVEFAALWGGQKAGAVAEGRVAIRRELIRSWPTNYRTAR
jgi:GT2 family glycosyltransferase